MEEGTFIKVYDWIIQDTTASEALCYALLLSFCKDGSKYSGGMGYLSRRLNMSRKTVKRVLTKLIEKGLAKQDTIIKNNVEYNVYWLADGDKTTRGQIDPTPVDILTPPCGHSDPTPVDILTPNNINNKDNNKENNKDNKESNDSSIATAKRKASIDYEEFKEFFNMTMDEAGAIIPRIDRITPKRKGMINARVKEYGMESVREVVRKSATSTYMNGAGRNGWVATFDWIFSPNNFIKILENNYNDNNPNNNGRDNIRRGAWPTPAENATRAEEWATKRILELTQPKDKGIQGEIPDGRETDKLFLPF